MDARRLVPKFDWVFQFKRVLFERPPLSWTQAPFSLFAITFIGLFLSLAASVFVWQWEQRQGEDIISDHVRSHILAIQKGLDEYLNDLEAVRAFFEAIDKPSREQFETFATSVLSNQKAVQNFSWAPLVTRSERAEHERIGKRDGMPGYQIKSVTSDDRMVASPERDEYFPIYYSSVSRASRIYGVDLLSQPALRQRLERARDYNVLSVVPDFILHSKEGGVHGFLFSLPIYRPGHPKSTMEDRRRNFLGFAHGAFITADAIEYILNNATTPSGLDLYLFADNAAADAKPLYVHRSRLRRGAAPIGSQAALAAVHHATGVLSAGEARWKVVAVPVSGGPLSTRHDRTWFVLASGISITLLGTFYHWSSIAHARHLLAANKEISNLAHHDALTGLANRRVFNDRLTTTFAACRNGGPPFAVLYFDLDHFKDVNDTLGHPTGDLLLQHIADRVRTAVRRDDIVARFGGDEFAILQVDASAETVRSLATRLSEILAAPFTLHQNIAHITVSIGIADYVPEIATPETIMMQADLALYRAKGDGRNCFRFHSAELDQEIHDRVIMSAELRNALEHNQLRLYYQPQVELATGRIIGVEALIRWQHPQRGLLGPGKFIATAERTGTIGAIGQWVINEACRQMRLWCDAGLSPGVIAVNVSAAQFKGSSGLADFVSETLSTWRIAPAAMEVELTESVLMEITEEHNESLEKLRRIGVKIAIDDFGTGYSSLNYLTNYPVSRLKIAQELVFGVVGDRRNATVVRAAIRLADDLRIDCIAEGVETLGQVKFLIEAGCDFGQGHYFTEAVSSAQMTSLLQERSLKLDRPGPRLELVAS